jgi:hypothetical protein
MASRKRRVAQGCLVVVIVLAAVFLIGARRFIFKKHWNVVSIATTPEYHDAHDLERAWALPVAAKYKDTLVYQSNGSACGPTSATDVDRSWGKPGETVDDFLAGTGKCRFGVCFGGVELDELAGLLRDKSKRRVTVLRDLTLDQFREAMRHANDPARRYTINFDRGPLFGTSMGHHSPIGGYLEDEDLVFVLDVNEKYKPWLVKTDRLFTAMDTIDEGTGKKRGLLLIEATN